MERIDKMTYEEYIEFREAMEDLNWQVRETGLNEDEVPSQVELSQEMHGVEFNVYLYGSKNNGLINHLIEFTEDFDYDDETKRAIIENPAMRNEFPVNALLRIFQHQQILLEKSVSAVA